MLVSLAKQFNVGESLHSNCPAGDTSETEDGEDLLLLETADTEADAGLSPLL